MTRKITALVGLAIILIATKAMAFGFSKDFSAEMVNRSAGREMRQKFYTSQDKIRMEMGEMVMIIRHDLNVSWMIMPSQGMYMEQPIDPRMMAQASERMPGEVERKTLGREEVSGVNAEKFMITYTDNEGSKSIYQWMGPQEIPLKMASVNGEWEVEYQNIQLGSQDAALFEPPAGFQKMAMPNLGSGMIPQGIDINQE